MNTRWSHCEGGKIFINTFYAYFHSESKDIVMLDHKKPDWLLKEQPYFKFIGTYEVSYMELARDLVIPTEPSGHSGKCNVTRSRSKHG